MHQSEDDDLSIVEVLSMVENAVCVILLLWLFLENVCFYL